MLTPVEVKFGMLARHAVLVGPLLAAALFSCGSRFGAPARQAPSTTETNVQLRAFLQQGSSALKSGENAQAENAYRQALALAPRSLEILNNLAIALAKQGKLQDAIPFYKRALSLKPGDPPTERNLALAYFKLQDYARALPLLASLHRRAPSDFQLADLLGLSYFGLDRYTEAAKYLDLASNLQPADLPTLYMLGQARLRCEDYKAVTTVFARIMDIDPHSAEAHVMMGTAYDKTFQQSKALQEYLAAEQANPDFPGVHSGLGLLYWKQNDVEHAEAEFHEELKRFSSDAVSNCLLGEIALRRDGLDEARSLFLAALAANPKYKEALFGLGKSEIKLGHPGQALDPLRKAVRLDPDYVEAHYQLGNALALLGRIDEARKERAISAAIQAKQREEYAKKLQPKG